MKQVLFNPLWKISLGLFLSCLIASTTYSQYLLSPSDQSIVLETGDGMILVGSIEKAEENSVTIKSTYGTLIVPVTQILRIDGDQFDPQEGIVRAHSVTLRSNGSAILDYLQPISYNASNRQVSLLMLGQTVSISDLHGELLDFMANKVGDFTRCSVTIPTFRLPAVRIQVLQPAAASVQDNQLFYTYRYTPRIEQTFSFQVTLPAGATVLEATPQPTESDGTTLQWKQLLRRQEDADFTIVLAIP